MVIMQFLIAIDQLLNTLLGGWADETLSARAYRRHVTSTRWRRTMKVINAAFFWQDDHCRSAYISEQARRHLPTAYRDTSIL